MLKHPRSDRWSGYRVNAEAIASNLVNAQAQYLALGGADLRRQEAYKALLRTDGTWRDSREERLLPDVIFHVIGYLEHP